MTMTLISTVTVGAGGAAVIDFSSIPQTYTDLLLVMSLRNTATGVPNQSTPVYFNGAAQGNVITQRWLETYSGTIWSSNYTNVNVLYAGYAPAADTTANVLGNTSLYITNYSSTSGPKGLSADVTAENNSTANRMSIWAGVFNSNAAITQIGVYGNANLVAGSTISLYGITKGSGGATVS